MIKNYEKNSTTFYKISGNIFCRPLGGTFIDFYFSARMDKNGFKMGRMNG